MLAFAGCGGDGVSTGYNGASRSTERTATPERSAPVVETVAPSHCPAGLPSCRTTEGRITYVERVDPDGDGDAHFVVADSQASPCLD